MFLKPRSDMSEESPISPECLFGNFLTRIVDLCRIDVADVKFFVSLADCYLSWK